MDFNTILKEISEEIAKKILEIGVVDIKSDDKSWTFKVVASMESEDRAWDIIKVNGWDIKNYEKNPIMLFWHDYWNIKSIIGWKVKISKTEINWVPVLIAEWVFSKTDHWQVARQLYDEWILKTVSVGFRILETGDKKSIVTKAELLEISFAPVPCHQDALSIDKSIVQKGFDMWILVEKKALSADDSIESQLKDQLNAELGISDTKANERVYVVDLFEKEFVYNHYSRENDNKFDKYFRKSYEQSDDWVKISWDSKEVEAQRQWVDKTKSLKNEVISSERFDKIEEILIKLETSVANIKAGFVEKKEDTPDEDPKVKKALEKIASVVNTTLNKYKKD